MPPTAVIATPDAARYDLVIRGGRVIDPANQVDGELDVAVSGDRIAAIEPDGSRWRAVETIDARGKLVVPGLLDLHTHIYKGVSAYGLDPDRVGLWSGCTHVNDMGSVGWLVFSGFTSLVAEPALTDVSCFLNIVGIGISENWIAGVGELVAPCTRADLTAAVARNHLDVVRGVKVHMERGHLSNMAIDMWQSYEAARQAATDLGVNLYVHLGDLVPINRDGIQVDPEAMPLEVVKKMKPGEVLGHCFTPHAGGLVTADGRVLEAAREATRSGILHEVGHGVNMSWDRACRFLDAGLLPDIISSDVHAPNAHAGRIRPDGSLEPDSTGELLSWSMVGTMTKCWALGMSLPDVVRASTITPARAMGLPDKGTLGVGARADIAILDVRQGRHELVDTLGETIWAERVLLPAITVLRGEVWHLDPLSLPEFHNDYVEPRPAAPPWSPVHQAFGARRIAR